MVSVRREFRLHLSHVDRGIDLDRTIAVSQSPAETAAHLVLRVLAFCLFHDERLEMGSGLGVRGEPDLVAHDLTGALATWIACGDADPDEVLHLARHNRQAQVQILLADGERAGALAAAVREGDGQGRLRRRVGVWLVPGALVDTLAALDARRQHWRVTIVGEHAYVEADGRMVDGELVRVVI